MLEIFPAIDLKEGKAVRLYQGEISSAKIYGDALDFARKFEDFGARWVHIVDLDGAFCGQPKNLKQIESIKKSCQIKIQLGGGIRDEKTIQYYLDLGIDRLILGSVALKNPAFAKEMAEKYPIAIGIDSKDGLVATEGWVEIAKQKASELAKTYKNSSVQALICTDIHKDGALSGVNADLTLEMALKSGCFCIASGGVKDISDLEVLESKFKEHRLNGGVIIGKAYYENKIDLPLVLKKFA